MKQVTCEMCGGTDLLKQDGVFVCQSCGSKYSVEEARKLMVEGSVEVQGTVQVQNAAQFENLLNLAHSSFDSKNYAQAEQFCNQVIAIDNKNYDAWKLKGEAINYQINVKNQRILEVYNCIMTSYNVLDETEKEEHREEILDSLRTCLEGEIDFWLEQFEAQRPTDEMLEKVKNTFLDCAYKVLTSFIKLGYDENEAEKYKSFIKAYFVMKAITTCTKTWASTVFYNYARDSLTLQHCWSNEEYRPSAEILKTYIHEGGNLINLLEFCTEYFSEDIPVSIRITIYEDIIYYHEKLSEGKSYKRMISTTTNGYGAVTDRCEYWEEDVSPTADAIESRKKSIALCREKIKEEIETDSRDKSINELIKSAREYLEANRFWPALYTFELIIKDNPQSPVGYLGKAVCMKIGWRYFNLDDVFLQIILASENTISQDEKEIINFLVNFEVDAINTINMGDKKTLLLYATQDFRNTKVAKYLIEVGADIDYHSPKHNYTALYNISSEKLPVGRETEWREIAQLLIQKGADPNVVAFSGISLYNEKTDPVISEMLLKKYPNLCKGKTLNEILNEDLGLNSNGGCYVATAVYGSYDCPQVWTLRRYRDYTLAEIWYGRAFIKTYYAISPTLVKWFGHTEWFKKMWQGKLDRMVAKLQANGVESTPYEDKKW